MTSGISTAITFRRNGYLLRFHPSALTSSLWINPEERMQEERFLSTLIKKGDTVIDVGANIGTISLALTKRLGKLGKCHAIEPHPRIYKYLKNNIALNNLEQQIETYHVALGENEKTVLFSDQSDDSNNQVSENGPINIEVKKLDDIVNLANIQLLKIDVEGYEYEVLKGAKNIAMNSKLIYLECIPELLEKYNAGEEQLVSLLKKYGFKVFQVKGEKLIENKVGSHLKKMLLAKKAAL